MTKSLSKLLVIFDRVSSKCRLQSLLFVEDMNLTSIYPLDSFMLTTKPPPTSDPNSIMLKPNTPARNVA